jgi:hypothetical protein
MKTIEISDESYEFIKDFMNKVNTQDNRITASPYFYVIKSPKWRVAHDDFYAGETKRVWIDMSGEDEYQEYSDTEEFIQYCLKNKMMEQKEAEEYAEEHLKEFTMEQYTTEDNVFFTEDGYKKHVELNGHNLNNDHYSYVKHAFRNPELRGLFKALGEVSGLELEWK